MRIILFLLLISTIGLSAQQTVPILDLHKGEDSCASKSNSLPIDQLNLDPGLNWISIPRLLQQGTNPGPNVNSVLSGNIQPANYGVESFIQNLPPGENNENTVQYTGFEWPNLPGGIQSIRGYKLLLDYPESPEAILEMYGDVVPPNTEIYLHDHKENWVGYFLHEKQDIFDAIDDFDEDIYVVKGQDYYCYRGQYIQGPGQPQQVPTYWICDKETHNIDYGEMVVLMPYADIPNFKWNYSGNPPTPIIDETPQYFTYTETADYSALIIELDSTDNPLELGAMINDSCIGACTVSPNDTLVIIKGYLGTQPGDSVVFEEYFETKSSTSLRISDYYVLNQSTKIHEKRTIKTGENKSQYFISFKDKKVQPDTNPKLTFNIFPNPASKNINMVYLVNKTSKVSIIAYDNYGRKVATLLDTEQPVGSHSFEWKLIGDTGKKLNKGLYIIKLKINDDVISKKVVIN